MSDFGENDFEDMNGMDDMMNSMPKEPFYKDAFSGITESAQEIIVDNMPAVADTFGSTDDILDSINEQIEKVKGSLAPLEEVAIGIREGGKASVKEFQQSRDIKTAIDAYKKTSKRVQNEIAKAEEDEKRESVQREREYKEHQQKSAVQSKLGFDMTSSLKAISEKVQGSNEQLGAFVNLSMANDDNIATSTALVNSKDRQRNTNSQIMAMATFHTESLKEAKRTNALLESSLAFSTTITGPSIYAGAEHQLKLEASQQDLINLNKDTLRQLQFSAEMVQKSNISHSIKSVFDTDGNNVYRDVSDFMTYDGGLDISKISGRLLDNITPMIDILTMVPQMFGDRNMRSAMSSSINPIKSIAKQIPKQLLSAKAKDAMTKTNRSIGGLGPLLLGKLDESARGGNSISSAIQRMIGLDATPKSHAKLGQKNIPVPFDMVTRRSIVDVIPEHLSGIESALTGLPQRMFDHQGGKMTTKNQVQEKFQSRIDRMGTSPFYDIRSAMEENHDGYDPERTDDYNKIFSQMLKSGKNYNPRNITKADRKEFINILGGKKKDAGRTDQFIKDLSRLDPHISNQFLYAISAGRSEMQKDFTNLEREIGEYGGGEAIANINNENEISYLKRKIRSSDIDGLSKAGRLKIKQSNLDIEKQIENLELSRGSNINSHSNQLDLGGTISNNPITKIYDLLSKGIIVFPDNRYDAEEVGRYSMLPPHLRDIQKQQKIKYDARQILTKAKHDADLLRKSKIAEAESDYRREETETDTRFMGMKGIGEGIEGLRNKVPFNNWIIKGMGKIDEMINSALFGKIEKPEEGTSKVNIPFVLDKSSPSFMEEGPQVDLSQKTKRLAFSADGPQGLVNKMSIWSIGLMEKMNHALLGDDYDPLKNKSITSSFQDLQKNLQDKLFGNKKDGKIGLLQKLTSPLQSKAEDLKHAFMDKIGSELAHTMRGAKVNLQHGLQDATNSIKDASLGLLEKAKVKANEWKEAQKAKGDDTITSKLINKVSKKGKVIGAYAEAAKDKFGEYTEESLRRRVARGQVSQEEYDKWIDEKSSIHTKEDKRHKSVLDDIEKSKSNINLDVANSKDKNFSKDLSATEERLKTSFDNVKGMSSKDHKADKANC
ncbi:MAG: hypothetical protein B6229_07440 [Spirochaetaceae bacterium 4572_7]|nr:MAG: hypothetical protein B6229_07440 [Spirochaetaceae bacterium 4572_7]